MQFPLWRSRTKSNEYPWGCRLDPWLRSLGRGSSLVVSWDVGWRCSSDPMLLWLWGRLAASAPIQPPAWEPPDTSGAALKSQKKKKKSHNLLNELLYLRKRPSDLHTELVHSSFIHSSNRPCLHLSPQQRNNRRELTSDWCSNTRGVDQRWE